MYSSLLKRGNTNLQGTEKRVIDTNELVARRISALAEKMERPENAGFLEHSGQPAESGQDGEFVSGLAAQMVEGLLEDGADDEGEGAPASNVIKARDRAQAQAEAAALVDEAKAEAERILEAARTQAKAEADSLRSQAEAELAGLREETVAQAREQGYQEGIQRVENELKRERMRLEQEYQTLADNLEPQFIDAITGIYEHIFNVELRSYREIIVYLISATLRRIEGSRSFLIHVSKDDYPYVSMNKKQISQNLMAPNSELEIVEDITLGQNECMIETEGGIFDCGLGTQMTELNQKLKLLSYERS